MIYDLLTFGSTVAALSPDAKAIVELLILLFFIALPLWALVDAAAVPDSVYRSVGRSKARWLVLIVMLTFFTGVLGTALAVYYLVILRPRLRRARIDTEDAGPMSTLEPGQSQLGDSTIV